MFVTRDVSQPEMSASKSRKFSKRELISVTPETHQSAMGPCFSVAEAASLSYSAAAVFREALSTKVLVQGGGGGEGGGGEGGEGGGGGEGGEGEAGGGEGEGGSGDEQLPGAQLES